MKAVFITGTDTSSGKTFVSSVLLREFNALGLKTFGMKPIASGCEPSEEGPLQNEDALCLQAHSSIRQAYHVVNPIALREPIAPHIAAARANMNLSTAMLEQAILASIQNEADINLIEGVGGWCVPLNDKALLSDVISLLNIPVILVVGIRLGCLNHALLTYLNILSMKVPFIGWIANCVTPDMPAMEDNIQALKHWITQPCLGVVPYKDESLGHINARAIYDYAGRSKQEGF